MLMMYYKFSFLVIILLFILSNEATAQQDSIQNRKNLFNHFHSHWLFSNDTVIRKGIKFRVTNFAVQGNASAIKHFYDSKTEKYFGNHWGSCIDFLIYYKKLIFGFSGSETFINLKDTLYNESEILVKDSPLGIFKSNLFAGYNLNIGKKFSVIPYAEILLTGFQSDETNYESPGFGFGIFLNKYIQLSPGRNLIIFINNRIDQTYYSDFNPALGNHYYSIGFGIGYQFLFLKKL
jgi:hypothetical protein